MVSGMKAPCRQTPNWSGLTSVPSILPARTYRLLVIKRPGILHPTRIFWCAIITGRRSRPNRKVAPHIASSSKMQKRKFQDKPSVRGSQSPNSTERRLPLPRLPTQAPYLADSNPPLHPFNPGHRGFGDPSLKAPATCFCLPRFFSSLLPGGEGAELCGMAQADIYINVAVSNSTWLSVQGVGRYRGIYMRIYVLE